MSEDMTVKQLRAYIANLPDELLVYVGLGDSGLEPLAELHITSDYIGLMATEDEDEDASFEAAEILDAEVMSFERKQPA